MSTYANVGHHLGMVYDEIRNTAYANAIREQVSAESVVLDLGAGLGIHGLIAASCGAARVYLVDSSPVIGIAEEIAAKNGFADRCICIQKSIEEAEIPEKVDLIISVLTGNFLLMEDLLPSLFVARDRFLKPSGKLLPEGGRMVAAPVSAADFHHRHLGRWSQPASGFSFEPARVAAANQVYCDRAQGIEPEILADPVRLMELDFRLAARADCHSEVTFEVNAPGDCHGILGWFELQLGSKVLSTAHDAPPTHWSQAFLPLDPPLPVGVGEKISFKLVHPQSGEWTWMVRHGHERRRHSTFFARKLDQNRLKRQARQHKSGLTAKGELTNFVLSQMDGTQSVGQILEVASLRFGGSFSSLEDLQEKVLSIISRFGS